jgi:hypothetical protein
MTSHEIARKLLSLPELPFIFDGLGKDIDLKAVYVGRVESPENSKSPLVFNTVDVVVIELVECKAK